VVLSFALLVYGDEDAPGPPDAATVGAELVLRFLPSTTSLTWRRGRAIDGPVRSGRIQLLGLVLVDCDGLDAALGRAEALARGDPRVRGVELRPLDRTIVASPAGS
jgi:hypothetical protein